MLDGALAAAMPFRVPLTRILVEVAPQRQEAPGARRRLLAVCIFAPCPAKATGIANNDST